MAVTVVAIGLPSMVKCTTVLASPVPLSASFEVMWSLVEAPVSKVSASVSVGPVVLSVIDHRAAGAGVAGDVGDLRGQRVAATVSVTGLLQLPLAAHGAADRRACRRGG